MDLGIRGIRPRRRAVARIVVHARQRLLRHPRCCAREQGGPGALPGHLRRRDLQPPGIRCGGATGGERGPGEPPQLAAPAVPSSFRRRIGGPVVLSRRAAIVRLPAHIGSPPCHVDAHVPVLGRRGGRRAERGTGPPGAHGGSAPGRAPNRFHVRGVVGRGRGRVRPRRRRDQQQRPPLPVPQPEPPDPGADGRGGERYDVAALPDQQLRHRDQHGGAYGRHGTAARVVRASPVQPPRRTPTGDPDSPGPARRGREDRGPAHLT